MKKLIFLFMFLWVALGQAQEDVKTKNLDYFTEVKVFDKIKVTLVKSDKHKVIITGYKRYDVEVIQEGLILKIRMSLDNLWDKSNTEVLVHYEELRKIDANEGSTVEVKDVLTRNKLDLRAQEGAIIQAKTESETLFIKAVTGGEVHLEGIAKEQEVVINSGGKYFGSELETKRTQVKISAGGVAEVNAKDYIKANTNAGGSIRIYGDPKQKDTKKFLGGKIVEVN
ncbi:head GIN domain-containing protein [Aquimarina sp. AU58]|uniref:head GIN domain-containing protein n=1 Tax=Aquimarina sp. AU58 TaxID=1874112 RepID=UPI000D65B8C8|nr:head GIN domain-containing protein [Aquimarina sp. AU58]